LEATPEHRQHEQEFGLVVVGADLVARRDCDCPTLRGRSGTIWHDEQVYATV
jgi:hypothetical protein